MADSRAGAGNRQDEPDAPHSAGKEGSVRSPPSAHSDGGVTKGQRIRLKELLLVNAGTI